MLVPQNIDLKPPKASGNVSIGREVLSLAAALLRILMYVPVPLHTSNAAPTHRACTGGTFGDSHNAALRIV